MQIPDGANFKNLMCNKEKKMAGEKQGKEKKNEKN